MQRKIAVLTGTVVALVALGSAGCSSKGKPEMAEGPTLEERVERAEFAAMEAKRAAEEAQRAAEEAKAQAAAAAQSGSQAADKAFEQSQFK